MLLVVGEKESILVRFAVSGMSISPVLLEVPPKSTTLLLSMSAPLTRSGSSIMERKSLSELNSLPACSE